MNCPNNHGQMKLVNVVKEIKFRDRKLTVETEFFKCPICEIEVGTVEQTAAIQKNILDKWEDSLLIGEDNHGNYNF